ncbi:hypothetical protein CYLTODRAFT_494648 [Cylindrobasidium torrendii FP15055 ss-10]|uniref:NUDE domain-containing protein n=1 Tax=Cylindrobasidium torrendii FP15055 ss-10 TaxID=1314674 RepID=A0A0D7AW46_9AGAR|nr:hypothetical protein CYLTODRAFT_494648 [Cylindrobasidium torrendii FP15055 ss-10]
MAMDDSQLNLSAEEWREKYNEVADMLAETRGELDDFHTASKELEAELESELARTEKAQQDLKVKVAKAETERDDWKGRFMSLQTNHNTTTTSLQRELDKLRQDYQHIKVQLRELEMGNDDLERTERAVSSSLADVEAKYSRALEEKILLEHELLDKANYEEQCQRYKDELRDANAEISILKDQLIAAQNAVAPSPSPVDSASTHSSTFSRETPSASNYDLFSSTPPSSADLRMETLGSSNGSLESLEEEQETPRKVVPIPRQPTTIKRSLRQPTGSPHTPPNGIPRSATMPSPYSPSSPVRSSVLRTPVTRKPSTASTASTSSTVQRSRGVQMVSEMRARVKNLEQKIHTRVPRLRMGGNGAPPARDSPVNSNLAKSVVGRTSWENPLTRKSSDSKRSVESVSKTPPPAEKAKGGDGWVLIMEDSPSPKRLTPSERRRISSPTRGSPYQSTPASPTYKTSKFAASTNAGTGLKRPQSRLSATSSATTFSSSSRPVTPTFLPTPSLSLYSSTAKRSVGPGSGLAQPKRSSLGASTISPKLKETGRPRPVSDHMEIAKPLPTLPSGVALNTSNVTVRGSRLPTGPSALGQSRIGRLSGGGVRRRSSTDASNDPDALKVSDLRPRSGSSAGRLSK